MVLEFWNQKKDLEGRKTVKVYRSNNEFLGEMTNLKRMGWVPCPFLRRAGVKWFRVSTVTEAKAAVRSSFQRDTK